MREGTASPPVSAGAAQSQQQQPFGGSQRASERPGSNHHPDFDAESISQPKAVLDVPRKMLQKVKAPKTNPIEAKNAFDSVGGNGIFSASPAVIKFAGFEANKTHTLKVRIINNSPAP